MRQQELFDEVADAALLLGAVCLRGAWELYAATLGEWTLDYPRFDPSPIPDDERQQFRNGLVKVDETTADEFRAALSSRKVPLDVLQEWIREEGADATPLTYVVNFDRLQFVDGYNEPIESKANYIPRHWAGLVAEPLDHVPTEMAAIWRR